MTLDELRDIGVDDMDESAMANYLQSQRSGVLGLPGNGAPYLVPLSFGYDGDSSLYFTYVGGGNSTKRRLTDRADRARFLVYDASSQFTWESLSLSGTIASVPASELGEDEALLDGAWRPDLFDRAADEVETAVYRFEIEEWSGIRQSGLPPGFRGEADEDPE